MIIAAGARGRGGSATRQEAPRLSQEADPRITGALGQLIDYANRSSVVLYTVDTRGLATRGLGAGDDVNTGLGLFDVGSSDLQGHLDTRRRLSNDNEHGLQYVAQETGGFLVRNQNDLTKARRARPRRPAGLLPDRLLARRRHVQGSRRPAALPQDQAERETAGPAGPLASRLLRPDRRGRRRRRRLRKRSRSRRARLSLRVGRHPAAAHVALRARAASAATCCARCSTSTRATWTCARPRACSARSSSSWP